MKVLCTLMFASMYSHIVCIHRGREGILQKDIVLLALAVGIIALAIRISKRAVAIGLECYMIRR